MFLVAPLALAQTDRGTITGTVTDPSGAVVAHASVEVTNTATGAEFGTTTTATGNYTVTQLPYGVYELSITADKFKKYIRRNLRVEVAQVLRVDATLDVGSVADSITIAAESSLLKPEGGVSYQITGETLNDLPILGIGAAAAGSSGIRNPSGLTALLPGAFYTPNAALKLNGAPANSERVNVEGIDASNQLMSYSPAQTQPSVDAIQEVAIQTSNFAAEYGTVGGGLFNVTMRSGGNEYHGGLYDYVSNEILNAGNPFTGPPFTRTPTGELVRPRARRIDYGWTFGGPASIPKLYNARNRAFFFFNFEQFREIQDVSTQQQTVPIPAYTRGDFSAALTAARNRVLTADPLGRPILYNEIFDPATQHLAGGQLITDPFPGNTIPLARMDPVALKIQKLIPAPNEPGFVNNFAPDYPSVRHSTIPAVKLDWNIGSKGKLSFYWSFTHTDSQYSPLYGNSDGLPLPITTARGTFIHSHIERLNYDRTLTPRLLLHLGLGYQQNNYFDDSPVLNYDAQSSLGLKGATVARNFPTFNGLNTPGDPAGGMASMGPPGQAHFYLEKPAANASLAWVRGNHTYKAGAEFRLEGDPLIPYTATNGAYTFSAKETAPPYLYPQMFPAGGPGFAYASFLLGAVDNVTIAAPSETRQGKKQVAFFLQDSWKIARKVTIDYGLRWDYGTYPREQYGRALDFSPETPNPSAGGHPGGTIFEGYGPNRCHCDFASNYPYAFGPRLGVAYQIAPRWVLRAGWGIVYDQTGSAAVPGVGASTTLSSPGNAIPAMYLQTGIPITPVWPVFSPGIYPVPGTITPVPSMLDPNAGRPARQNQWSVSVQREISRDFVAEASYVGNRGVWWPAGALQNMNALTPQLLAQDGLDYRDPKVQTLLLDTMNNPAVVQAGFRIPYSGFPSNATLAQALRPFPQFGQTYTGSVGVIDPPLGKTWYDSLQVRASKRLSHGLAGNLTYAWQKSLQQGVDTSATLNNILANPANAKSFSSFDQPRVLTISGTYEMPKLTGNRIVSYALRDWKIGAMLQYASGQPIPTPNATTNIGGELFQNTLANRVPGVPLYTVDLNCHCFDPATTFVLNPKAWVNPPQGQFGASAEFYNDFRYQRHPRESLNLARTFKFKERYSLMIRADFQNVFNRVFLNNPQSNNPFGVQAVNPVTHLNSTGFGYIRLSTSSTQFGQPRQGTIVARFEF